MKNDEDDNIKHEFKSTDFVLNLSATVDLSDNFLICTRYGFDLSNIVEEQYNGVGIDVKSIYISISVGFRFNNNEK